MTYLLDTNVVSDARRRQGNAQVVEWFGSVSITELYLSVLALGEIRRGIELLRPRDEPQTRVLEAWLADLERQYSGRILPITSEIADTWGRLNAPHRSQAVDSLMAATAIVHNLTIVTRNVADFARAGLPVLNPFEPPA